MANSTWWWSKLTCGVSVDSSGARTSTANANGNVGTSRVRASSRQFLLLQGGNGTMNCSWQLSMLIRARYTASMLLMIITATCLSPHLMLVAPCQHRAATSTRECQSVPRRTTPSRFWMPPALNLQLRGGAQVNKEDTRPQDAGVNVVPWDVVTGPGRFRFVCNNAFLVLLSTSN